MSRPASLASSTQVSAIDERLREDAAALLALAGLEELERRVDHLLHLEKIGFDQLTHRGRLRGALSAGGRG